ncbi:hypothetical protein GCM10008994_14770 [Halorubrum ejinorense]|uniref:Uncharacterized protein n=1 Tax=Halorubrum ejinorense TaxID=425309 RepID=A0AAV3SQH0_9EURY
MRSYRRTSTGLPIGTLRSDPKGSEVPRMTQPLAVEETFQPICDTIAHKFEEMVKYENVLCSDTI